MADEHEYATYREFSDFREEARGSIRELGRDTQTAIGELRRDVSGALKALTSVGESVKTLADDQHSREAEAHDVKGRRWSMMVTAVGAAVAGCCSLAAAVLQIAHTGIFK